MATESAEQIKLRTDNPAARRTRTALFTGLVLGATTAVYLAWSLGILNTAVDLGFKNRLPIWQHVLELWRASPIFGHGYQLTTLIDPNGVPSKLNYAHSLFLSTLRDGGLVGGALLLLLYFSALRAAVRMALTQRRALYLCLFVFGLVCVLVDTDRIVTRPRELWVILWLPLAFLAAYEVGLEGDPSADPSSTHGGHSPKKAR